MAKRYITLPETYDPYDPALKKLFDVKADDLNFIYVARKNPYLACGATRRGKICKVVAGSGTDHVGYGRCKYHGGASTGPSTAAGKAAVAQNGRKHGFYSQALYGAERDAYERLLGGNEVSLADEIFMLKAKILVYLDKWRAKYEVRKDENDIKVYFLSVTEGESGDKVSVATHYYHAGTIEDRPLIKALEALGRLIEKHARLNPEDGSDLLQQINQELRAASHGRVTVAWGGRKPQGRTEGA